MRGTGIIAAILRRQARARAKVRERAGVSARSELRPVRAPSFILISTPPGRRHWLDGWAPGPLVPVEAVVLEGHFSEPSDRWDIPPHLQAAMERAVAVAQGSGIDLVARQKMLAEDLDSFAMDSRADRGQEADAVGVLVDLARQGARGDFRDLALMTRVSPDDVEAMWSGTRRRLGLEG